MTTMSMDARQPSARESPRVVTHPVHQHQGPTERFQLERIMVHHEIEGKHMKPNCSVQGNGAGKIGTSVTFLF